MCSLVFPSIIHDIYNYLGTSNFKDSDFGVSYISLKSPSGLRASVADAWNMLGAIARGSGSNPGGVYNIGPVYISMSELRPREEKLDWYCCCDLRC